MSSLLDFADFGLSFFGSSGKKEKISREKYRTQNVDYYRQGLDTTGIKVDYERDPDKDEDEDRNRDVDITQVGMSDNSDETLTPSGISNLGTGFDNMLNSGSSLLELQNNFRDFNTSLQDAGFKDRSDSPMYKAFGLSTAAVPQSAKEVKKDLSLKNILSPKTAIQTIGKVTGLSPVTNVLAGFVGGATIKDPLGNNSYRPSHAVMGLAFDMNMSIQSSNISQSMAALNANNLTGYRGAKSNTGFFGYIDGQLVSRAPNGKTYSGVNAEYGRMAEAFSKGYAPLGYNVDTETGDYSIASRTGAFSGYDQRGYHVNANGFSRAGLMSDVRATGKTYGIEDKAVISALEKVRSQYNFLGKVKDDVKDVVTLSQALAEVATAESDKKAGIYSTPGSELGDAAGSVGSTGDLGGATDAGYSTPSNVESASSFNDNNDDPGDSSSGGDSSSMGEDSSGGGYATAKGGFISRGNNFALGGKGEAEPAGFIEGPPEQFSDQTTIADDIPLKVKDGTFVINAPAVEYAGSIDVQKMLAEGYKKALTRDIGVDKNFRIGKIPSREELDIQISRGEVVVPPHVAKAIGYDRLEKINNRGKREVERRQKAGNQEKVQAGQGFAAKGGKQVSIADIRKQFKKKYSDEDFARKQIAKLIRSLPPEDALALAMYSEANVLGEEGLEGVAHVVMNRVNAVDSKGNNYRNFGKNVYDTLLAKYTGNKGKKIFEFNGLEPTGFRDAMDALVNNEEKYLKIRNIAEDVFRGSRKDFTKGSLYYYNPYTTTSDWYKGQVKTGQFKEIYRTLNPDKKQNRSLHVYHVPVDDYFVEKQIKISPQVTPTEDFKSLDTLPQPKPRPKEVEDRSDDDGGFIDYLRKLF
jgi:spore germination cell wall hydrolase CwlJ-like protein